MRMVPGFSVTALIARYSVVHSLLVVSSEFTVFLCRLFIKPAIIPAFPIQLQPAFLYNLISRLYTLTYLALVTSMQADSAGGEGGVGH